MRIRHQHAAALYCSVLAPFLAAQDPSPEDGIVTAIQRLHVDLQRATLSATFLDCEYGGEGSYRPREHPYALPGTRTFASWSGAALVTATFRPSSEQDGKLVRATYTQGGLGLEYLPEQHRVARLTSLSARTEAGWPQLAVGFVGDISLARLLRPSDVTVTDREHASASLEVGGMHVTLQLRWLPSPHSEWAIVKSIWRDTRLSRTIVEIALSDFKVTDWGTVPAAMTVSAYSSETTALQSRLSIDAQPRVLDGHWFRDSIRRAAIFDDSSSIYASIEGAEHVITSYIRRLTRAGESAPTATPMTPLAAREDTDIAWPTLDGLAVAAKQPYNISHGYCAQLAIAGLARAHSNTECSFGRLLAAHSETPVQAFDIYETARGLFPSLRVVEDPLAPGLGTVCALWGDESNPGHAAVLHPDPEGDHWSVWEPPDRFYRGTRERLQARFAGAVLLTGSPASPQRAAGPARSINPLAALAALTAVAVLMVLIVRRRTAVTLAAIIAAVLGGCQRKSSDHTEVAAFCLSPKISIHVADPPNDEAVFPMKFVNGKDEPCIVSVQQPACGCLMLSEKTTLALAPGEHGALFLRARPLTHGIHVKSVSVTANWPRTMVSEDCQVFIVAGSERIMHPRTLVLRASRGSVVPSALVVTSSDDSTPNIESTEPCVFFVLENREALPGSGSGNTLSSWTFSAVIADDAAVGMRSGEVIWHDGPDPKETRLLLEVLDQDCSPR